MRQSIAPRIVHVVHMGDSITFGQYVDPALRWTTLTSLRLQSKYRHEPVIVGSVNRGVSGETSRMALERFPADVQAANPDVLTLQFGLNDCNCWLTDRGLPRVSEDAYRANLKEMIARAQRFGVREIILANNHRTLRLKPLPGGEIYEQANARYSAIAQEVAKDMGVIFCDIRQRFMAVTEKELAELLLPYPDLLHLSAAGNRVYADTIWPCLEQAVEAVLNDGAQAPSQLRKAS